MPGEVHIRYQGKFLHGKGGRALEWVAKGGSGIIILEVFTKGMDVVLENML